VAGKRQLNPSARKDATTLSPSALRRTHSECFIGMILVVLFRKGDLQQMQKCVKRSYPVGNRPLLMEDLKKYEQLIPC
jgi:hypothetical protein